ncbi:hypothetical protein C8R44DRAFT_783325 [Mycena epipterygia]|nr:hypothetical protein C8R44DRAFT_783325 [Mycena epipterygia]
MGLHTQLEPSTSKLPPSNSTPFELVPLCSSPSLSLEQNLEGPRKQPSVADLAALGIKARDFAYESTLPPIPPFVRRQVQPGASVARSLKRMRREPEEDPGGGMSPRKLRRRETQLRLPETSAMPSLCTCAPPSTTIRCSSCGMERRSQSPPEV